MFNVNYFGWKVSVSWLLDTKQTAASPVHLKLVLDTCTNNMEQARGASQEASTSSLVWFFHLVSILQATSHGPWGFLWRRSGASLPNRLSGQRSLLPLHKPAMMEFSWQLGGIEGWLFSRHPVVVLLLCWYQHSHIFHTEAISKPARWQRLIVCLSGNGSGWDVCSVIQRLQRSERGSDALFYKPETASLHVCASKLALMWFYRCN